MHQEIYERIAIIVKEAYTEGEYTAPVIELSALKFKFKELEIKVIIPL